MKKELVVKHNKIIESKYSMTTTEAKIMAKLTSVIKKDDEDFKRYHFKTKDLLKELGLGYKNYTALKDNVDKLITRKLEIKQENNKTLVTTFLSSCLYDNSEAESTITLKFDPDLKPYFLQLQNNFTKYYLINILELKSFYSIRIYELLKQYENIKKRTIDLEELKSILNIDKEKAYKLYGNIKLKILKVAQKEINKKTDIKIEIEEIKTGRKVTAIKFHLTENKKPIERPQDNPQEILEVYSEEVLALYDNLSEIEQIETSKKELEKLLKKHDFYILKDEIDWIKNKNPENFFAYLIKSCNNGYYSTEDREKKKKKEELEIKNKKRLKEEKKRENKNLEIEEKKILEIYEKLSEDQLEEYGDKFSKSQKYLKHSNMTEKEFILSTIKSERDIEDK